MKTLGYIVHDLLTHPVCALLWIARLHRLGNWLHDITVFECNRVEEVWPPYLERFLKEIES